MKVVLLDTNIISFYSNGSKNRKNFGVSTAIEAFGAKSTAALLGYNLQMNYSTHDKIFWSLFFEKGNDLSGLGAVEPTPKREKLLKYLNEGGFLFGYRIADTQTGPYLRMGISYLSGKKNNDVMIKAAGIPLEGGVNFQLTKLFAFSFGITGNLNMYASYYGFKFSLNFGIR